MRSLVSSIPLLLALVSPGQAAPPSPRQVIEKAIQAHGGQHRLAQIRTDRVHVEGTIFTGISEFRFAAETTLQLPGQFRSVLYLQQGQTTHTITHLLDGDRAAILIDGKAQTISTANLVQLKQTLLIDAALRLVPLLDERAYRLSSLPDAMVQGRPASGVRVQGQGQRDLRLWFDREQGHLVKTEHLLDGPEGKDIRQEAFYSDLRDLGGYTRACKVVVHRQGTKVMEGQIIKAEQLERLQPREFRAP